MNRDMDERLSAIEKGLKGAVLAAHCTGDVESAKRCERALKALTGTENEAKRYWYPVCLSAEDDSTGYVCLTPKEARTVADATNPAKWTQRRCRPWSGTFNISLKNKRKSLPFVSGALEGNV